LILSSILGLATTQVDYTAAFAHADVGEDVSMESEYVSLSTAMRDLIPLKAAVSEIASGMGLEDEKIVTIKSTIW
jgi:hypothetical protein